MAVSDWPASLPQRVLRDGYSEGMGDGLLISDMEAGPGKVRQRFRPARPLQCKFRMTTAQLATMQAFVRDDLAGGSLPFNLPAISTTGTIIVRFQRGGKPSWVNLGPNTWDVSLNLEIMP